MHRIPFHIVFSILLVFVTLIMGCEDQEEILELSDVSDISGVTDISDVDLEGLYRANIPPEVFYLKVSKSSDNAPFSAYCFTDKGSSCDSIAVTFDEGCLVSVENNHTIVLFKAKGDDLLVTFPGSNLPDKAYPLYRIETPWNNVVIDTNIFPRYLHTLPNSQVAIQEDVVYDNQKGFYTGLSSEDGSNSDYVKLVTEKLGNNILETDVVPLDLKLDLYHPRNDVVTKRPLIVMAHGGAFLFGDKQSAPIPMLANDFAGRGYVVASINYRLGTTLLGLSSIERTIYRAVQDYRSATRFLINNAHLYGIDTTAVFYMGHSAGAITALTAAIMEQHEVYKSTGANLFRDDLGPLPLNTQTKGVVSLSGGVTDLELIDHDDNVNMLLFHGTDDDVVPFHSGMPFEGITGDLIHNIGSNFIKMYGSAAIEERMQEVNLPCKLHAFNNVKHDLHLNADDSPHDNTRVVLDTTINYLYERLTEAKSRVVEHKTGKNSALYTLDNHGLISVGEVKWDITGGAIVSQSSIGEIEVYWFTNAPNKSLHVTVKSESGIILESGNVM